MRPPTLSFVAGAGDVVADLDRLMEFGAFVEGTSRSGKTNLVRVFLEQTYGLVQHIVLDIEGEYASLRSSERPYLIVGNGRDVALPAEADAIRRFVLAIVEKGVSVIFDLSEHDTDEQHTIVAAVCDALVSLPENHPGAAAVVLEEMQEFAPEGGGKGTALASVKRLSKRGLKRGFFIIGASQRVSDVSKGIVTQLKTKMIGGTDHKDAPRALEELGLPSRDRQAITDLAQGEFWVKGPAFERHAQHVHVPRSVTAPPKRKRGDPPAPAPEAPAEIAQLAAALAASVATATKEVDAPEPAARASAIRAQAWTALDADARRARRDVIIQRARDEARHDEAQRHERYRQTLRAGADAAIAELRVTRNLTIDQIDESIAKFEAVLVGIDEQWIKPVAPDAAPGADATIRPVRGTNAPAPAATPVIRGTLARDHGALPKGQQGIVDAIAFYESIGNPKPAKRAVGGLAGVNPKLSTWRGYMAALRQQGFVRDVGTEQLELTDAGRAFVRGVAPPSLQELQDRWVAQLNGPAAAILRALVAVYPSTLTKEQLGQRVGVDPTLSTWRGHMVPLRRLGLVDDVSRGELRASALLFPEGLQ